MPGPHHTSASSQPLAASSRVRRRQPLLPMQPSLAVLISLLLAVSTGTTNAQENWNYKQMGRDWSGTCSAGGRQSPINIETTELREVNDDRPLQFFNYNRLTAFDVIVDAKHHTIKATPKGGHKIAIAGGGLPGVYKLDSFHFHWPAEHTIDSNKFIMEAHFVHIKSKYNSSTEAAKDPEGIAVLGVLYTEGKENLELFKVEQGARDGQTVLNLEHMLPHDKNEFYRYKGSLTTPSCSEAVIWTVFRNYVSASPTQVATFRGLLPEEDQAIDTNRATQPLNGRMVELWTTRGAAEYNRVQHLSPHPSLLFALLPGLSNSIQLPKFGWK